MNFWKITSQPQSLIGQLITCDPKSYITILQLILKLLKFTLHLKASIKNFIYVENAP